MIDPLSAFIQKGWDINKDQDVRAVLSPLADLASQTGAAIVLVRHLRKNGASATIYRGAGSIGVIGAARVALLVVRDVVVSDRCAVVVHKSNLGSVPPAEAFRVVEDPRTGIASVRWEGAIDIDPQQALSALRTPSPKLRAAEDLLRILLSRGPVPAKEIFAAGSERGLSKRTVEAAKRNLGIDSFRESRAGRRGAGRWMWCLSPDGAPAINTAEVRDGRGAAALIGLDSRGRREGPTRAPKKLRKREK